jgi:hypothetical protein
LQLNQVETLLVERLYILIGKETIMNSRVMQTRILTVLSAVFALLNLFTDPIQAAVTLSSISARVMRINTVTQASLSWKTASEIHTAGFNIYRSVRIEGPYTRINTQLIPASNDLLTGGTYQYFDTDIQTNQTYYYQLEDVEFNGTSVRHPPIRLTDDTVPFESNTWVTLGLSIGGFAFAMSALVFILRRRSSHLAM